MTTDEIQQAVSDYAYQYGIPPGIALAQIGRESNFNPRAVGSSGERGLGQFMSGTWQRFGQGSFDNAFDVDYNLTAWGKYMTYLSGLFGGDISKMLTAYNGGEGHLTNPGRYGPPSRAALNYASAIIASANQYSVPTIETTPDLFTPIDQTALGAPEGDGIPIWLWAVLGLAVIVVATR